MQYENPKNLLASATDGTSLRIALLGYRSHPHVGGQGVYIKHLSKALRDLGHQVDVFSGPPYPLLADGVNLIKVPSLDLYSVFPNHIRAFKTRYLTSWTDFFEWWTMASGGFAEPYCFGRRLFKKLEQLKQYDIVHDNQSLSFGLLELQKHSVTVVSTIHHPITRDFHLAIKQEPRWVHRLLIKRWYSFLSMQIKVAKQLEHIVTVSKVSKQDIAHDFGCALDSISVVPNGINTQIFKPNTSIARRPFRLITTTSSDQPLKGFATLLHALAIIRQQIPGIHLRVIGQLKQGGANEKLLKQLDLNDCVSFRTQLTDEQVSEQYAKAQIAICPSLYEGFGLPALEAMACAVPLVSSDGGALPEVISDAGNFYPAGDASALANQVLALIGSSELRSFYSHKGLQRATSLFCWQSVAIRMTHFYQACLKQTQEKHKN